MKNLLKFILNYYTHCLISASSISFLLFLLTVPDRSFPTQFPTDNIWSSLSSKPKKPLHSLTPQTITIKLTKADTNRNLILMHRQCFHRLQTRISWSVKGLESRSSQSDWSKDDTCWVDCRFLRCKSKSKAFVRVTIRSEPNLGTWKDCWWKLSMWLSLWHVQIKWGWSKVSFSWLCEFTFLRCTQGLPSAVCLWLTSNWTVFLWVLRTGRTSETEEVRMTTTEYRWLRWQRNSCLQVDPNSFESESSSGTCTGRTETVRNPNWRERSLTGCKICITLQLGFRVLKSSIFLGLWSVRNLQVHCFRFSLIWLYWQ